MPLQLIASTNSFSVNGNEFPVNCASIAQKQTLVGIFNIYTGRAIVDYIDWTEYTQSNSTQYANQAALVAALKTALFKNLS